MTAGQVFFVGAGPGAPDLLTLRGKALIEQADLVIYADSLVDPALTQFARPDAEIIGSSSLTLEQIMEKMVAAARDGKTVVRLHSGDPGLYGAVHEQSARLDEAGVAWSIVPGVSAGFAAAALLGCELTVPEVAQTVIFTRVSGRATPVPPKEELRSLAEHQTSLVIFLAVNFIRRVVDELVAGGYPIDTPAAVVYKATWPDELVLTGTLATIADQTREARLTKQALIMVGPALGRATHADVRSRLYSPTHTHIFRRATAEATRSEGSEEA